MNASETSFQENVGASTCPGIKAGKKLNLKIPLKLVVFLNIHLCSGWKICHRFSVEAPEFDECSKIVLRMSQLRLSISANAQHNVIAFYNLHARHADLAGSEEIQSTHLAEALQYRPG